MGIFSQTFHTGDLLSVLFLVLLEGALSADNALVLAVMVKQLSKEDQHKALLYGLGGAFVFRLAAILLATFVLHLWWLQGIGAAYLLILPIKHFIKDGGKPNVEPVSGGLWKTVLLVEATDMAFAIDSVLAGVGFVNGRQDKIWVVYFGAIIGIVLLRFAASGLIKLLEKYPFLDKVAYTLVFWVGVKLAWLSIGNCAEANWHNDKIGEMPQFLFWTVLVAIAAIGAALAFTKRTPRTSE